MHAARTNAESRVQRRDLRPNAYLDVAAEDFRRTRLPLTIRELYVENPDVPLRLQWKGGWEHFEPTTGLHLSADGRNLRVMKFLRRTETAD
ncbi:DUF5988 family protein [Lentzea sp. E54]|uniref:DUF5988 family protein n=1 Tax=Lentzea xerophila TaxID=3435883 RepID=UPI003DA3B16D